ncbi:MAG: surface glycoprotein, partial [Clostridia bacterium]|nr:surface glycoprotein [Clostridia bacterium]
MKNSMMKKPISILLSLLMVLSVFGGMAFTASAESSGTYNGFSWTLGDDGALSITGSGSIGSNDR